MVEILVLGSGSRGNCTLLRAGGRAILVDAGFSAKEIAKRLAAVDQDPGKIEAILVTHEHADHVGGLRVLARRTGALVLGNLPTLRALARTLVDVPRQAAFVAFEPFGAGPFAVTAFPVPHDAADPVGFVLEAEGVRVGYATDLGHVTRTVEEHLAGCAAVVFESNHDREMLMAGPYPWVTKQRVASAHGHLSNEHAAAALPAITSGGTEHLVLAHLSETNNHPQLARAAVHSALEAAGLSSRVGVQLALQDRPGARIAL